MVNPIDNQVSLNLQLSKELAIANKALLYFQSEEMRKHSEELLRGTSTHIRFILENSPAAIRITSKSTGLVLFCNRSFCELTGEPLERAIGIDPRQFYANPNEFDDILECLGRGERVTNKLVQLTNQKELKWALASFMVSEFEDQPAHIAWLYDITSIKRSEEILGRYKAIIDSTSDAILSKDLQGVITSWNGAAETLYGYLAKEAIGQNISMLVHQDSKENLTGLMKRIEHGESFVHYRAYRLCKDGRQIPVMLSLSPIKNLQGQVIGISSVGHDISEQVRLEQRVLEMAFHDALTKLANRHLLEDRINLAFASNQRSHAHSALLYIDLDNFKPLNDTHGHEAGDLLLIEVARRLKSSIRAVDTVSRVGGDEFVVLITDLEEDEVLAQQYALAIAEKIRLSLEAPYVLEMVGQYSALMVAHICSVSIGLVLFSGTEKSQEDLLKDADTAMYEAKHTGRNAVRIYQQKN